MAVLAGVLLPLPHLSAASPDSELPPAALAIAPEKLAEALRLGLFSQVIEASKLLLATNTKAPVFGLKAAAHAALNESEQANAAIRRAKDAAEPNAELYSFNVQASLAHAGKALSNAVTACEAAIEEDPKHPLAYVTLSFVRFDETNYAAAIAQATAAIKLEERMSLASTALAQALQAQGNLSEAATYFQNAWRLDTSDVRPHLGLGEIALLLRDYPQAIGHYRAVLASRPDLQNAREALGRALLAAGKLEEAIVEAKVVLGKDSGSLPAGLVLSRAYAQGNRFTEAVEQLDKLLGRNPTSFEAGYLKALCLIAQGRVEEAMQGLSAAIQGKSKDPGTLVASGILAQMGGHFGTASNLLAEAREQGGLNWQGRVHFHLGNVFLSAKQWGQATNELGQATGIFDNSQLDRLDFHQFFQDAPPVSAALVNLGSLFLNEGWLDVAIQMFRQATDRNPANVIALLLGSNALGRSLKYDDALELLRKLSELAPRYAPAAFAAGEIQFAQRAFTNAIQSYTRAVELDPHSAQAFLRLGTLYGITADYVKSESAYRQALVLLPASALAMNELANLLAEPKGNLDEALSFATQAVELGGNDGMYIDTLGWVYYQRQEYTKALETFQRAIQAQPSPRFLPVIRYHLGLAYHKTGESGKALKELQTALKIAPAFPEAEQAKALIKKIETP